MHLNLNGKPAENEENSRPRRATPMMLAGEINHLMMERIERHHDPLLDQRSIRALIIELAHKDGRTQLELVNATRLKAPTVSIAMQKLEHAGIVTRRPDEYDLRATRVFLTEKGRELDNRARQTIDDAEEVAMEKLTEEEKETLFKLLWKVRESLIEDSERVSGERREYKRFENEK